MATTTIDARAQAEERYNYKLPFVIGASAIGTVIEWYDFYLYGVLATFFSAQFFPQGQRRPPRSSRRSPTFGAGFAVRPFGAVVFGRIGDVVGRKFTFLRDDHGDGRLDRPRRPPADLRADRHPRADPPRHAAPRPGPRARRRVRRRRDLRRRAQPRREARPVHQLDPDHGDPRAAARARRDLVLPASTCRPRTSRPTAGESRSSCRPSWSCSRCVIRVRLQRDAPVRETQGRGKSSTSPWRESFGDRREPPAHPARAVRRDRRPGRRVVPGPVPGAVLPEHEPRRPIPGRIPDRRHGARARRRRSSSSSAACRTGSGASRSSSPAVSSPRSPTTRSTT